MYYFDLQFSVIQIYEHLLLSLLTSNLFQMKRWCDSLWDMLTVCQEVLYSTYTTANTYKFVFIKQEQSYVFAFIYTCHLEQL